jgi:thioredoxin reductase (NADPH)
MKVIKMQETDQKSQDNLHDIVMIGAGPSALAAAIYTTREDLDTVLVEKAIAGGMVATTDWVDNYPGFAKGISGLDLAEQFRAQAERFGAKFEFGEVSGLEIDQGDKNIIIRLADNGEDLRAKTVLIATGSSHKKLNIPGEDKYYGRGVHYCATCDGAFYRDKKLVVVGGGNSAVQEAIFLTRFASHIDLLVRSQLRASEVLQHELDKFVKSGKITIHLNTSPDEILAKDEDVVNAVKITTPGKTEILETDGVFVFIGLLPNTNFLQNSGVKLDDQNFIVTDNNFMTNLTGVFASGDVRSGATMQIVSSAGEGATASLRIRQYLEEKARG